MVLRWEGCELFLLFVVAAVVVRFDEKYSAVAGLVHTFDSWQSCVRAERIAQHASPGLLF